MLIELLVIIPALGVLITSVACSFSKKQVVPKTELSDRDDEADLEDSPIDENNDWVYGDLGEYPNDNYFDDENFNSISKNMSRIQHINKNNKQGTGSININIMDENLLWPLAIEASLTPGKSDPCLKFEEIAPAFKFLKNLDLACQYDGIDLCEGEPDKFENATKALQRCGGDYERLSDILQDGMKRAHSVAEKILLSIDDAEKLLKIFKKEKCYEKIPETLESIKNLIIHLDQLYENAKEKDLDSFKAWLEIDKNDYLPILLKSNGEVSKWANRIKNLSSIRDIQQSDLSDFVDYVNNIYFSYIRQKALEMD